ncbi:hypothetical protein B296_00007884 [Ensete ventricosum]|uniref:Uncharacterized protein n=1 Tax=Ensete ventricosum TaxID=4639 RepID=A0A427AC33_ENSVE|nr:hypothetical protein B296_00007884 [Ensete ventricosum]
MRKLVHIDQGWDAWLGLVLGLGDLYLGRQLRLLFSQVRSEDHERIRVGVLDVTPPMLKSVPREDLVSVLKKSSSPLFLPSSGGFILTSRVDHTFDLSSDVTLGVVALYDRLLPIPLEWSIDVPPGGMAKRNRSEEQAPGLTFRGMTNPMRKRHHEDKQVKKIRSAQRLGWLSSSYGSMLATKLDDAQELLGGRSGVEAGDRKGRGSDDESSEAQLPKSKALVRKEVDSDEHHSAAEADLPIVKEGISWAAEGKGLVVLTEEMPAPWTKLKSVRELCNAHLGMDSQDYHAIRVGTQLEHASDAPLEIDLTSLTHRTQIWLDGEASTQYAQGT